MQADFGADGDYVPLSIDADGALRVAASISPGAAASEYVDDADWTDNTSVHTLVGGIYQSAPQTVTDGDTGPFNMTTNGGLHVAVQGTAAVSNAGLTELAAAINASSQMDVNLAANGIGIATSAKQDTEIGHLATIAGDTTDIEAAIEMLAVRQDAQADFGADGDYVPLSIDADGALRVAASITPGAAASEYEEDTPHVTADIGTMVLGVRQDAAAALAANGDYIPLSMNNIGAVRTFDADVFDGVDSAVTVLGDIFNTVDLISEAAYLDDEDWTDGASYHILTGGLYQSAPQSVTDGDVGPFNMTVNGALHVSDAGGSLTVDNAGLTELAGAINASAQMDVNIAANGIGLATSAKQDTEIGFLTTIAGDTTGFMRELLRVSVPSAASAGRFYWSPIATDYGTFTITTSSNTPVGAIVGVSSSDGSLVVGGQPGEAKGRGISPDELAALDARIQEIGATL